MPGKSNILADYISRLQLDPVHQDISTPNLKDSEAILPILNKGLDLENNIPAHISGSDGKIRLGIQEKMCYKDNSVKSEEI